jgi:hypothetical protein
MSQRKPTLAVTDPETLNRQKARRQNNITMKAKIAALIFIGSLLLARADQMIESVQQA